MKSNIISTTLAFVFFLSTGAVQALVRENIPATYIENRDLTFRYKNMNTPGNKLKIRIETVTLDTNGNPLTFNYSRALGNMFIARGNRKATIRIPIVASDTRVKIFISGGVVSEAEPLDYRMLILDDLESNLDPLSNAPQIPDEFGNASIGAVQGPVGPQGPQGETGAQGPQGPAGTSSSATIGGTIDVNGRSSINIGSNNYLTFTDSNPGTVEIIETLQGGTRGQVIYIELSEFVKFRVNNADLPNTIHWGRGTTTGDAQPTSASSDYRFIELIHNGVNWFLVGRNSN